MLGLRYPSIAIVMLMLPVVLGQSFPLANDDPVIVGALVYITSHQAPDGGFGEYGEGDLSTSSRACEAIIAAGGDPLAYETGGLGVDDYFLSIADAVFGGSYGSNPIADKINLIIGLSACGLDARNFGGHDFVTDLLSMQNQTTMSFGGGPSDTAYSILALLSAGISKDNPALQGARDYLESSQLPDGTFEYSPGWGPDSNTHSVVIITLKKMESCHGCWNHAVGAIPNFMNGTNRGFYYQGMWGTNPDVSSTSLGIQAIVANSKTPLDPQYASGGENAVKYLLGTHNSTTGEFFDPWGSLRPTTLAVPALLGYLTPGITISEIPMTSLIGVCIIIVWKRFQFGGWIQ